SCHAPQQGKRREPLAWCGSGGSFLALRGLTGLLNPCVKSCTKLCLPYFMNCFNCASSGGYSRAAFIFQSANFSPPLARLPKPAVWRATRSDFRAAAIGGPGRGSSVRRMPRTSPALLQPAGGDHFVTT